MKETKRINFRPLRADEIEVRVGTCKKNGVSLLLYKNSRVDMDILDETLGEYNWKRTHARDNANCIVSIWDEDKKEWISKEDVGTESNTEREKGLASDSFKRACVNLGIGRELYSSPFIWVTSDNCTIVEKNGKPTCYDRFRVEKITYTDNKKIDALSIVNDTLTRRVFVKLPTEKPINFDKPEEIPEDLVTNDEKELLKKSAEVRKAILERAKES